MNGEAAPPAANHLYDVNTDDPVFLNEDDASYFHTMVAKLLFLGKRARPDILQAISFLTTRVKKPDQDDYKKLSRVIQYLRSCPHLPLALEADEMSIAKWWVDASFAVHMDMKSHTGGVLSMGKGAVYATSKRQGLNTTSSTEAEVVGVSDLMPMVCWTRNFLEEQGFEMKPAKVHQDNMSAMLLEKNGKRSSGKRTRHIEIRYYFITDRYKRGELDIQHCPTDKMIADFFTKPLQGSPFYSFRRMTLNIQPDVSLVDAA